METRICKKCKKRKYLLDFTISNKGLPYTYCKDCNEISKMKKDHKNDIKKRHNKNSYLKISYGIDIYEYERMLNYQGNKCAICKEHDSHLDRALSVDHCHSTGKVRKLLCQKCNLALGLVEDNIKILESMINYLEIFNELHKLDK